MSLISKRDESSPVGQYIQGGDEFSLKSQLIGRINCNTYFPYMLDTKGVPCIYKRYDIMSNITMGTNNGGDEQLLIICDLLANQEKLGYVWARTVNNGVATNWNLVQNLKIAGSLDEFAKTRITEGFLTVNSDTISTTNTNLSGKITGVAVSHLTWPLTYSNLSSWTPNPQNKTVNVPLSSGIAIAGYPTTQDFTYAGGRDPVFTLNTEPYFVHNFTQDLNQQWKEYVICTGQDDPNWLNASGTNRVDFSLLTGADLILTLNYRANDHDGGVAHDHTQTIYNIASGSYYEYTPPDNMYLYSLTLAHANNQTGTIGVAFTVTNIDKVLQTQPDHFKHIIFVQGSIGVKNISLAGGASYECLPTPSVTQQVTLQRPMPFNPLPNDLWKELYWKGALRLVYPLEVYYKLIDSLLSQDAEEFNGEAAHVVGGASILSIIKPIVKYLYRTVRPTIPGLVQNGLRFTDNIINGWSASAQQIPYEGDECMRGVIGSAASSETRYEDIEPSEPEFSYEVKKLMNQNGHSSRRDYGSRLQNPLNFWFGEEQLSPSIIAGFGTSASSRHTTNPHVAPVSDPNQAKQDTINKWIGAAASLEDLIKLMNNLNPEDRERLLQGANKPGPSTFTETKYSDIDPTEDFTSNETPVGMTGDNDVKVVNFDSTKGVTDAIKEVKENFKEQIKQSQIFGIYNLAKKSIKQQFCLSTGATLANVNTFRMAPFVMFYNQGEGTPGVGRLCFLCFSYWAVKSNTLYKPVSSDLLRQRCIKMRLDKSIDEEHFNLETGTVFRPDTAKSEFKLLIKNKRFFVDPRLNMLLTTEEGKDVWLNFLLEPLSQQLLKSESVYEAGVKVANQKLDAFLTLIEPPEFSNVPIKGNSFAGALNQLVSGRDPSLVVEWGTSLASVLTCPCATYDCTGHVPEKFNEMNRINKLVAQAVYKRKQGTFKSDVTMLRNDPGYAYALALMDVAGMYLTMVNYRTEPAYVKTIESQPVDQVSFTFNTLEGIRVSNENYKKPNYISFSCPKDVFDPKVYLNMQKTTPTFLLLSTAPNEVFKWRSTMWNYVFSIIFPMGQKMRVTQQGTYNTYENAAKTGWKDAEGNEIFNEQQKASYFYRIAQTDTKIAEEFYDQNKALINSVFKLSKDQFVDYFKSPDNKLSHNILQRLLDQLKDAQKVVSKGGDVKKTKAYRRLENVVNYKGPNGKKKTAEEVKAYEEAMRDFKIPESQTSKPVSVNNTFSSLMEALESGYEEDA